MLLNPGDKALSKNSMMSMTRCFLEPRSFLLLLIQRKNLWSLRIIHNHNHCYSKLKGETSYIIYGSKRNKFLSKNFDLHQGYIPFKDSKVSFIRLTNKEGKVRFFSETFLVDQELAHAYVKETIFTQYGLLKFYYDKKVIKIYNYEVDGH